MGRQNFKGEYVTTISYDIYKREEFLRYLKLSREEFFLLPEEERMAFGDLIYGEILDAIPEYGDYFDSLGFINGHMFGPYIEKSGCRFANYDVGIEHFRVFRKGKGSLVIEDLDIAKVLYHVRVLNEAKADAFEHMILNSYPELAHELLNGKEIFLAERAPEMAEVYKKIVEGVYFFCHWPREEQANITSAALRAVKENLEEGEEVIIPNDLGYQSLVEQLEVKIQNDEYSLVLTPVDIAK